MDSHEPADSPHGAPLYNPAGPLLDVVPEHAILGCARAGQSHIVSLECSGLPNEFVLDSNVLLIPQTPLALTTVDGNGHKRLVPMRPFSVLWLTTGEVHRLRARGGDVLLVMLDSRASIVPATHVSCVPADTLNCVVHADIAPLAAALCRSLVEVDCPHAHLLPPIIDWLVARCLQEFRQVSTDVTSSSGGPELDEHRLHRILCDIENRLSETLTISSLASSTGMSDSRFSRAFKASTGNPPSRYILGRRVAKARRLLETSELSLAAITSTAGFSSQSHMTFVFVKEMGVTPGQYRRSLRRCAPPPEPAVNADTREAVGG